MGQVARWHRPLDIEELVLAFGAADSKPSIVPAFPALQKLHTIGVHCATSNLGPRWLERLVVSGIANAKLVMFPVVDDVREALEIARHSRLAKLSIESPSDGAAIFAARDAGSAKSWLSNLAGYTSPDVKIAMPVITPELERDAKWRRITIVPASRQYVAKPRA